MWLLKNNEGDKTTSVGRKRTDLVLENDNSISKNHAVLRVQPDEFTDSSSLIVKDDNSKYGSSILTEASNINLKGNEQELKHLDKITFGLQNHTFTVFKIPIKICISQLNKEDSSELETYIKIFDAIVVNKWKPDCTHVTTSKPTLTQKVVQALISNLPIINISYWREVLKSIERNVKFPDPKSFILEMSDTSISKDVSLCPRPERRNLFANLTFISFSKRQYKHYFDIIKAAGGKIILHDIYDTIKNIDITNDNVIILQLTTEGTQYNDNLISKYTTISNILNNQGRRIISETEIPLAILYCSINQHCNPSYDFRMLLTTDDIKRKRELQNSSILVQDTQDVKEDIKISEQFSSQLPKFVKETCDESLSESPSESQVKHLSSDFGSHVIQSRKLSQNLKNKDNGISHANPKIENMDHSLIISSSNTKSENSTPLNSDIVDSKCWQNVATSTQKSEELNSMETPKSLHVEFSTMKNRNNDSLFTNADNRRLNIWENISEIDNSNPERPMEIQNDESKKRKRLEEDMESIVSVDNEGRSNNNLENNLLNKKQKTEELNLNNDNQNDKRICKGVIKEEIMLEFDDWGLSENNDFVVDVEKFGFVSSDKEKVEKKDDKHLKIHIDQRQVKRRLKDEQENKKNETEIPSTIKFQQKPVKDNIINKNKRLASEQILSTTPEKKRKTIDTINNISIEQVTTNIQNILFDENDFTITTDSDFCTNFDQNQSILRPDYEIAFHGEKFVKQFKKVYSMPIERVHL